MHVDRVIVPAPRLLQLLQLVPTEGHLARVPTDAAPLALVMKSESDASTTIGAFTTKDRSYWIHSEHK